MQQQSRCIVPPYSICLLYSLHLYPSSPAAAASVLQLRSVALPTISSLVNVNVLVLTSTVRTDVIPLFDRRMSDAP